MENKAQYRIILKITRLIDTQYDDDGRAYPMTNTTISVVDVPTSPDVYRVLSQAELDAADYGDGFSHTDVLAVCELMAYESLLTDSEYYRPSPEYEEVSQ